MQRISIFVFLQSCHLFFILVDLLKTVEGLDATLATQEATDESNHTDDKGSDNVVEEKKPKSLAERWDEVDSVLLVFLGCCIVIGVLMFLLLEKAAAFRQQWMQRRRASLLEKMRDQREDGKEEPKNQRESVKEEEETVGMDRGKAVTFAVGELGGNRHQQTSETIRST